MRIFTTSGVKVKECEPWISIHLDFRFRQQEDIKIAEFTAFAGGCPFAVPATARDSTGMINERAGFVHVPGGFVR